jgi:hypothetical protein
MQTEIDPPMNQPEDWRWEETRDEEPRDEFSDEDEFGDADQPTRPLELRGPAHSPPEILRALSMWTELDEDEFSDFDDEDFDDEFDDDFEDELEDEYEELEDDFDDEDDLDEDLDEGFEAIEGDEDFDGALPADDAAEGLEELDEE